MRRPLLILLILVVSHRGPLAASEAFAKSPLSLAQYIEALDDSRKIATKLKDEPIAAVDLLHALPEASWLVRVANRDFEIPTTSLRHDVDTWRNKNDEEVQERILAQLDALRVGAHAYQNPPSDTRARQELLSNILGRREFKNVRGPTWVDRLKQRLAEFLIRLLGRAFASSAIPAISDLMVYGLMVLAVGGVAYWMYRSIRESANLETIMPQALPLSAKEWPIWLREARTAAAQGDWREAVHLAYWSGISFLEAQGSWRADSARTPREYLRLLPASSERQPALRSLTSKLELVWYGMGEAGPEVFEQTLVELERLGCPCH